MVSIRIGLFGLCALVGASAFGGEAGGYRDPRSGLIYHLAGEAMNSEEARQICASLATPSVAANEYLLWSLWYRKGWQGFAALQKQAPKSCVVLASFSDQQSASESCVDMNSFGYFAFHGPRPVLCVETAGQKEEWRDARTGITWRDGGIAENADDAQARCQSHGNGWRVADVRDINIADWRLRDRAVNQTLTLDTQSCFFVTERNLGYDSRPTCYRLGTGGRYLGHFPTRTLCVLEPVAK